MWIIRRSGLTLSVLGTWSILKSWLSWKQNFICTCAKLDHHPLPVEPGILLQWFLRSWFLGIPLLGAGVKWFSIRLSLTSSSNPPKIAQSKIFVIFSLSLHAHLLPFSLLLSTLLPSQIPNWRTERPKSYFSFLVFMKVSSWVRIKVYWFSDR